MLFFLYFSGLKPNLTKSEIYQNVTDFQRVSKVRKMRRETLEGKIVNFETIVT